VRLLPRGPACRLHFHHAAVNPDHASGIPASWEGTEVVRHLRPPRGPTSLLFPADVALANAPAALSSPPFVRRDGLMRGVDVGAMMLFYLIWLLPRRLLGEKVRSQGVLFRGFLVRSTSDTKLKLVG
jgi:hypothetical protein